jgi:hypothetical protein
MAKINTNKAIIIQIKIIIAKIIKGEYKIYLLLIIIKFSICNIKKIT